MAHAEDIASCPTSYTRSGSCGRVNVGYVAISVGEIHEKKEAMT